MNSNDPIKVAVVAPISVATALVAAGCSFAMWTGRDMRWMVLEPGTLETQPWRAFTTILLHGGMVHLVFNLMWMWTLGVALEAAWGSLRFLALLVAFGAGAALAEYAVSGAGIGLSGAVYGFFGLLYFVQRSDPALAGVMSRNTINTFVVWFFLCIVLTWTGAMNVANTAHGAGAVLGGLLGLAIAARDPAQRWLRAAGFLAAGAAIVAGALIIPARFRTSGAVAADERRADALLGSGQYAPAAAALEAVVKDEPRNFRAWHNLAFCYQQLGEPDKSLDALRSGAQVADAAARPEFARMLGQVLAARAADLETAGDLPAALDAFHEAARWSPELEERFAMLGAWCAEGAGDPHEAARLYRLAARNPATRDPAAAALERLGLADVPEAP